MPQMQPCPRARTWCPLPPRPTRRHRAAAGCMNMPPAPSDPLDARPGADTVTVRRTPLMPLSTPLLAVSLLLCLVSVLHASEPATAPVRDLQRKVVLPDGYDAD